MKPKTKRLAAAILSAAMLILSACQSGDGDINSGSKASGTVYRAKRYTVSGVEDDAESFIVRDGRLYFLTTAASGFNEDYYEIVEYSLNSVDLEGGDLKSIPLNSGDTAISKFDFDPDGNIVYAEAARLEDTPNSEDNAFTYILKRIKPDGTAVSETDITAAITEHSVPYFSLESLMLDPSGNIVVNGYFQIIVLDGEGNYLFDVSCEDGIRKLVKSADGEIYVSAFGAESYSEFYKLDFSAKDFSANIDIVQGYDFDYNILPYSGLGDTDFYVDDQTVLCSYDIESGVKNEIMNFVDSDVIRQEINDIIPIGEGSFIGVGKSYPAGNLLITAINEVDASTIPEKTEITVAGVDYSIDSLLEYQAVKFNMENEKYRIVIKKYSGEDYASRLNNDITAGNIPDILISNRYCSMLFENYAAKGLFIDLYPLIDSDSVISREDFLPNVVSALETDGKLYHFTPSFKIFTAIGKTSVFGSEKGIDFRRISEIIADCPEGTEIFAGTTKENILEHAMELCGDEFIDYKTGKCDFNSDYFISLLEFANGFLNSIDLDSYFNDSFWIRYKTMFADEDALMLILYVTDFSDIFFFEHEYFGEEVTAVGFPTFSGYGAAFDIDSSFSISAKSQNTEGAWEFLRSMLSEDFQDSVYEFPVRKASLEKKSKRDMENFDSNTTRISTIGSMSLGVSGVGIESAPEQADVDKVMDVINSVSQSSKYNDTVIGIITEEAGAYFSGSRSAGDAAQMIQNRVQNYLDENL